MTVYVDNFNVPATVQNGSRTITSRWSHLTGDTQEELHAFAAKLGMRRSWFQTCKRPCGKGPCVHWLYDLTAQRRALAVTLGAVEIDFREMGRICADRRQAQREATP